MSDKQQIYVGTHTHPVKSGTGQILDSKGQEVYLLELDLQTGNLDFIKGFKDMVNPSCLAINRENTCLYAVNELKEFQGNAFGAVSAFQIAEKSDNLEFLNQQPTNGTDPCQVEIDPHGKHLFVSNFMSGSFTVFPILLDGSIGEICQFIQRQGSSVNPRPPKRPAHAFTGLFAGRAVCLCPRPGFG